jgi:hypothetical protein
LAEAQSLNEDDSEEDSIDDGQYSSVDEFEENIKTVDLAHLNHMVQNKSLASRGVSFKAKLQMNL